jgi:hypothetical protein
LAEKAGLRCASIVAFNRACSVPWWFAGRVLRRKRFSLLQVKFVNWAAPVLRRLDSWLPLPPLSWIATFEKAPAPAVAQESRRESEANVLR